MKKIAFALLLLLATLSSGRAQVSAEVVMEQNYFLVGEEMPAAVRITNRSGQTLHLGEDADWLTFAVESRNGYLVTKNGEVPVQGTFELPSGKTATRRVNLAPSFELNRLGRYQVNASVRIKDWNETIAAKPKAFEIINAAKIWSQEFGMPPVPGVTNQPPEVRRYTLEQANYLRGQLRLYLRLSNDSGTHVFKVLPIGTMVSISEPERQIDRANRLHVLYQFGARSYLYTVITPEGEIVTRQTHEITTARPRLRSDDAGSFVVVGGERRYTDADLPAPETSQANAPTENP